MMEVNHPNNGNIRGILYMLVKGLVVEKLILELFEINHIMQWSITRYALETGFAWLPTGHAYTVTKKNCKFTICLQYN